MSRAAAGDRGLRPASATCPAGSCEPPRAFRLTQTQPAAQFAVRGASSQEADEARKLEDIKQVY